MQVFDRLVGRERVSRKPIRNIFIANRGEIAASMVQTIIRRNEGSPPNRQISFVVPQTFSDANPIAARLVDAHPDHGSLIEIGGYGADESYLNQDLVLNTAIANGSDAIFLGYGLLAEKDEFVRKCEQAGIRVLGPSARAMELTGNKIKAREKAMDVKMPGTNHNIPTVPGTGNLPEIKDALRAVGIIGPNERPPRNKIDFPVVVKDPDSGGGDGVALNVRNQQELEEAYTRMRRRPENKQVFIEKFIQNPAHIEIQIIADAYGNVVSLGERDCTIQRKSQKIIEESPSPRVSPSVVSKMEAASKAFAKAINYRGVGTWEFIVDMDDIDPETGEPKWYFMEVNPRVQVERTISEMRTGVDILDTIISIGEGAKLPFKQEDIKPEGVVIQTRHYAEDPNNNYAQSEGAISRLRYPQEPNEIIRAAVEEGDTLSIEYDPTLLLRIVRASTREAATAQQIRGLSATELLGVLSNRTQLITILNSPEFSDPKSINTTWVDRTWGHEVKGDMTDLDRYINEGTFLPIESDTLFDFSKLLQDQEVEKRKRGGEGTEIKKYSQEIADWIEKYGTSKSSKIGIHTLHGLRYVLFALDYKIRAGTLGGQEGLDWRQACRLASEYNLPLISWSETGGADQGQNNFALFQMGAGEDALNEFNPDYLADVSNGLVFGAFPAAVSPQAKLKIMTRKATGPKGEFDSRKGITGPRMTINTIDPGFEGGSLEEMYEAIKEAIGVMPHHPSTLLEDRMVHILTDDAVEAADKVAHILHSTKTPQMIADPNIVFVPTEKIAYADPHLTIRFDRPDQHATAWGGTFGARLLHKFRHRGELPSSALRGRELTNEARLAILNEAERPTAADLVDTKSGLFSDVVFLSTPPHHTVDSEGGQTTEIEQYLPTFAAITTFEGQDLFVLAHQSSRVIENGQLRREFRAQRPEDWEYLMDMLSYARSRKYPVLNLAGTKGASGAPQDERKDQLKAVSQLIHETNTYPDYMASILLDYGGSGGVHTLFRRLNRAGALEHAVSSVADWIVMLQIRSGRWIDPQVAKPEDVATFYKFVNQHKDANAFGLRQMRLIDEIIAEGPALTEGGLLGAHNDPRVVVEGMRGFIRTALAEAATLRPGDGEGSVINHRRSRIKEIRDNFSKQNPSYRSPQIF